MLSVMIIRRGGLVLLVVALAAGCAQTELALHGIKEITATDGDAAPNAGVYKVGKPYEIDGAWYYPAEDPGYAETGLASWYGTDFHGKRTANGAVYDMNALTAAHRTLPMPFEVRVTNLDNGRSMVLTINDRGPYARGRIIDVSRRAAQLLGFKEKGTALVRVEAIAGQGWQDPMIAVAEDPEAPSLPASPTGSVERQALTEVASVDLAEGPSTFIQAGAFSSPDNARRLSDALAPFGEVRTTMVTVDGTAVYRVRLGPVATPEGAEALLERIIGAGHLDAHLVVE